MSERTKSRMAGVVLVVLGSAGVAWAWYQARATGSFASRGSMLGPIAVAVGLWLIVEGPELPAQRLSVLGWVFLVLGLIAGVLFREFLKSGRVLPLG